MPHKSIFMPLHIHVIVIPLYLFTIINPAPPDTGTPQPAWQRSFPNVPDLTAGFHLPLPNTPATDLLTHPSACVCVMILFFISRAKRKHHYPRQ